jgi:hypothetical protein
MSDAQYEMAYSCMTYRPSRTHEGPLGRDDFEQ